jgi:hypothetical protein
LVDIAADRPATHIKVSREAFQRALFRGTAHLEGNDELGPEGAERIAEAIFEEFEKMLFSSGVELEVSA